MTKSQLDDIKELEESMRSLTRQNAAMREAVKNTEGPAVRKALLDAADECDVAVRKIEAGLRGMRKNLR